MIYCNVFIGDVCYESIERGCTEDTFKDNDKGLLWTFNVKYNKCVRVSLKDTNSSHCQFKNLFNSESTCKQVCPGISYLSYNFNCCRMNCNVSNYYFRVKPM